MGESIAEVCPPLRCLLVRASRKGPAGLGSPANGTKLGQPPPGHRQRILSGAGSGWWVAGEAV